MDELGKYVINSGAPMHWIDECLIECHWIKTQLHCSIMCRN